MKTSIIILNYNDLETTREMIDQIKDYKVINHIIIVDNCSTDNSYKELKKEEKNNIEIIKTDNNKGYAYGNNYGIKYAINKYKVDNIIISNPDIIVTENEIKELLNQLKYNNVALIAPVINEHGILSKGWKLPSFKEDLLSNINHFHKYAFKKMEYPEKHYREKISEVEVVKGCFFAIKASVIKDVDYFDEGTFLYYEENILGRKLKSKGYKSYVHNKVEVTHNLSISVNKSFNSLKKYKILKQSQRYYEKKYNNCNIFRMFLLYITYCFSYFIAFIICLFRGGKQ